MSYIDDIYVDATMLLSYNLECAEISAFGGYDPIEDADYIHMLMEESNELVDAGGDLLTTKHDEKRQEAVDDITSKCKEKVSNARKHKNINMALGAIGTLLTGLTGASAAANGVTNPATVVSAAVTASIGIAKTVHDQAVVRKQSQKIDDYIDGAIVKTEEAIARGRLGSREDARSLIDLRDSLKREKKRLHKVLPF